MAPAVDMKPSTLAEMDIVSRREAILEELERTYTLLKTATDKRNALGSKSELTGEQKRIKAELTRKVEYLREYTLELESQLALAEKVIITSLNFEKIVESTKDTTSKPTSDETVKKLQQQVTDLAEAGKNAIQLQVQQSLLSLAPKMSIQTPNVKYVDANLAYRYADLQTDTNIFLGIATLFLGTVISTGASLISSLFITTDKTVLAVYWTLLGMSLLSAVFFGFLFFRAHGKADKTKQQLDDAAGEHEIDWITTK